MDDHVPDDEEKDVEICREGITEYILFFISNILAVAELVAFWDINKIATGTIPDKVIAAVELKKYDEKYGIRNKETKMMESSLYNTEE